MHQHYIFTYSSTASPLSTVLHLLEVHLTKKNFHWESSFHCLTRPFKNLNHLRRLWISNESSLVRKFNRARMCVYLFQFLPHVLCSVIFILTWNKEARKSGNSNVLCLFSCNCKCDWMSPTCCCCPGVHVVFKILFWLTLSRCNEEDFYYKFKMASYRNKM